MLSLERALDSNLKGVIVFIDHIYELAFITINPWLISLEKLDKNF